MSTAPSIPALVVGDRLSRGEFERRYAATPDLKKAELVEGVVYVASPVSLQAHGQPHAHVMTWLGVYQARTPGVQVADNATVRLDQDNEVQPDALLRIVQGGRSRAERDFVEGPPELVVEVSASRTSYDLHAKKNAYRRNGVLEYVVWRVQEHAIDWFVLGDGEYVPQVPLAGIQRSTAFPGLWLDVEALLAGNLGRVLDAVAEGLRSPEHAAFVARLSEEPRSSE